MSDFTSDDLLDAELMEHVMKLSLEAYENGLTGGGTLGSSATDRRKRTKSKKIIPSTFSGFNFIFSSPQAIKYVPMRKSFLWSVVMPLLGDRPVNT